MLPKSWRIEPTNLYIRRRDKKLVKVLSHANLNVKYVLQDTGVEFTVTTNGFRRGFRPATMEETQ